MSSAGASEWGACWNTKRTPSISISWGVRSTRSVGAARPMRPRAGSLPSPVSTWPRGLRARGMPYMKLARRDMAMPAIRFSLVASCMKPAGATMRTPARAASSSGSTASIPPKWSTWLWVRITAETGRSPRWRRARSRAARAVSCDVRGSTTIQPLAPSISVRFERS